MSYSLLRKSAAEVYTAPCEPEVTAHVEWKMSQNVNALFKFLAN